MHDLDVIPVRQDAAAVLFARNDFTVQLDHDASLVDAELVNEIGDRAPFAERVELAINDDVHAKTIVISSYLYNLDTIW
jgi:hypothetical protein